MVFSDNFMQARLACCNPDANGVTLTQFAGSFGQDFFAPAGGGDVTLTTGDLLAAAIAAGTILHKSTGETRPAGSLDFIASIDVDLKPTGSHVNIGGTQFTTTASDATHNRGGGLYDLDPGGSSSVGELRDPSNFLLPVNTGDIVIKEGSGIVVSIDIASMPA